MPKIQSTDDPRPPRLTSEVLEAVKTVLRSFPSGEQQPELELHLDKLKAAVKQQGLAATGDELVLALEQLTRAGLITAGARIGVWGIEWISADI
jgi:hypothetical protein